MIYRFNLEPIGSGKTLPERRKDREDVRWILRSAQTRRSIFQVQGSDEDIQAALGIETLKTEPEAKVAEAETDTTVEGANNFKGRTLGVVQTYFAGSATEPSYLGLNFAVSTPVTERVELIFAGQTGVGASASERLEATSRLRINDRHNLEVSVGGMQFNSAFAADGLEHKLPSGQFSVRAVDEWIVKWCSHRYGSGLFASSARVAQVRSVRGLACSLIPTRALSEGRICSWR